MPHGAACHAGQLLCERRCDRAHRQRDVPRSRPPPSHTQHRGHSSALDRQSLLRQRASPMPVNAQDGDVELAASRGVSAPRPEPSGERHSGGSHGKDGLSAHVFVKDAEGSLKVTRTLGDSPFHKGDAVSAVPGVRHVPLTGRVDPECAARVLAMAGPWSTMANHGPATDSHHHGLTLGPADCFRPCLLPS